MKVQVKEIIDKLIHSYKNPVPSIINLLGVSSRSQKEKVIKEAYNQFIKHGKESIVLTSLVSSSSLFAYVISHVPTIEYVQNRVYTDENKRYDLILLYFCKNRTALV